MPEWFQQWKFILVVALLVASALLATNKNKLPLALRGLKKILDSQNNEKMESSNRPRAVSPLRRLFAFLLVMLALILAII